jgi:hypothetical protein
MCEAKGAARSCEGPVGRCQLVLVPFRQQHQRPQTANEIKPQSKKQEKRQRQEPKFDSALEQELLLASRDYRLSERVRELSNPQSLIAAAGGGDGRWWWWRWRCVMRHAGSCAMAMASCLCLCLPPVSVAAAPAWAHDVSTGQKRFPEHNGLPRSSHEARRGLPGLTSGWRPATGGLGGARGAGGWGPDPPGYAKPGCALENGSRVAAGGGRSL